MTTTPITRTQEDLVQDKQMIRALAGLAADVELFTIPLYMTALYSIAGREAKADGSVFPYMGPTENYPLQGLNAQRSYNIIYSVYIQEMLHLQLALNIGNILGAKAALTQPAYPPKPEDENWIPCLGRLADLNPEQYPEFANIKAVLGPLDENAINLFLAIELPDDDSYVSAPAIPLSCQPSDVTGLTFGGIGNLYHTLQQYMKFSYPDGKTLFHHCYEEAVANAKASGAGKIVQVNQFKGRSAYSHMTLALRDNATPGMAACDVNEMINAIVSEGEGSSKNNFNFTSPNYRPDTDDIPADGLWGAFSHWARFEAVKELYPQVETWPKWRAERKKNGSEGFVWQDLVADPLAVTHAQRELALQRAAAWNDPTTADSLNRILNTTFDRFLDTLNSYWHGTNKFNFPMGAMSAISSRVSSVWAAGGVPEFKKPEHHGNVTELHACQGLNTGTEGKYAPGQCDCATAIEHACVTTNACAHQGGCGYPVETESNGDAIPGSTKNFIPGQNSGAGNGGCGAPIPSAQVFTDMTESGPGQYNGQPVWERARELFFQANPKIDKTTLTPSNIRLIMPPS